MRQIQKVQILALIILVITLLIAGFHMLIIPLSDWIVRITGIVMLVSVAVCAYSTVRVSQIKKKIANSNRKEVTWRKNLAKTYNPKDFEDRIYQMWEENGAFKAEVDPDKKPFTIVMPPPNITGQLHMGHALDQTLQDVLTRWKRMQGYSALWLPGSDHASIATEVKVVEKIREEEGKGKGRPGQRGVPEPRLGLERRVRRQNYQTVPQTGRFLRLEQRTLYHGRRLQQSRQTFLRTII